MQVQELLDYGKEHISYEHAKLLLAELLKISQVELPIHLNNTISTNLEENYKRNVELVKSGKPIQYVIGNVNFYGETFYINENVLIPRFETEELVENTTHFIKKYFTEPVDIIDLGCGSGVIGLTLEKKVSTNSVDLVDISEDALEVTHKNCENLSSKANLIKSDMFENVTKKYDVIISNPPYIKTTEEIEEIVKNNEPHLALYAGEDGLDCYRKILENAKNYMKERCLIAFEIGMTQAEDIKKIALDNLENIRVEVKKDLSGKDRMLFIFKNIE